MLLSKIIIISKLSNGNNTKIKKVNKDNNKSNSNHKTRKYYQDIELYSRHIVKNK